MSLGWTIPRGFLALACVVLIPVFAWAGVAAHQSALGWVGAAAMIVVFTLVAGYAVVGSLRGVLIDDRNVISLARFQMALWTAIIVSAFLTAALFNVCTGVQQPLAIQVPAELWTLMGISTTSLVGAPLILNPKKSRAPDPVALQQTLALLQQKQGQDPATLQSVGQILANISPALAQWSDMFTGDETSNGAHLDLAKVQMFFFTLLIAMTYCAALWQMFSQAQATGLDSLPALDKSAIALLGVSHAGYLVNKAVPKG